MNISFFGASVVQQRHDSGFVIQFNKLIKDNSLNFNVIQNGFGSMHLFDAGICKIKYIINQNPNICFISWLSTGYLTENREELFTYLDVIVRKLMLINCKICFLLLDRTDICEKRLIMYKNVIEYSKIYNLHYIELYNNSNKEELLRDDAHTNEMGAIFYASKIYNYFTKYMIRSPNNYTTIPLENEYSNIRTLDVNKDIDNEIILKGNFKIIGIYQKIGNFSGVIEITKDTEVYKYTIWDQWCHFERNNIKIAIDWSKEVKLKILQESFDTQSCKHDINFDKFEKYMYIHEIFYLGNLTILTL
jgi:hypothetical protein